MNIEEINKKIGELTNKLKVKQPDEIEIDILKQILELQKKRKLLKT